MNVAVIDIGGTFIKYAFMNENAEFISRGKLPTPMSGRDEFIEALAKIYQSMPNAEGIAISMPGIIDSKRGYCKTCGALKYNDDFYIVEALQKKCPVKITMENDAKCAAIAEVSQGSLKDVDDSFVMIFGTGIGGTFIKNRQVHYGHNFAAGEVSFVITDKDGGLIESDIFGQQCSAIALCKMYAKVKNLPDDFIDGVEVFNSINAGDSTALDCLNNFTKRIAVQISNIQMLLAPQKIAIGGGISVQPVFIDYIRKNINEIYDNADFKFQRPEVVACQFQNDANLIGALQFYISNG